MNFRNLTLKNLKKNTLNVTVCKISKLLLLPFEKLLNCANNL